MKGLEKLSNDLRAERLKASNALQDRARLRVEIETLKQKLEASSSALEEAMFEVSSKLNWL